VNHLIFDHLDESHRLIALAQDDGNEMRSFDAIEIENLLAASRIYQPDGGL
jgi:hypothetical protein